jgi:polyphosphate kinase 2 (PPK2 family)
MIKPIDAQACCVKPRSTVKLARWPTRIKPACDTSAQYEALLAEPIAQLSAQQQLLYAANRYAVLLIFQAMGAAGKDGVIRHVMSGVDPQGCQVFSY